MARYDSFEVESTGSGTSNHSLLSNLSYAASGHTGFAAALTSDQNYVTDAELLALGDMVTWATSAPSNDGSVGTAEQLAYDDDYLYVCIGSGNWGRVPLSKTFNNA